MIVNIIRLEVSNQVSNEEIIFCGRFSKQMTMPAYKTCFKFAVLLEIEGEYKFKYTANMGHMLEI